MAIKMIRYNIPCIHRKYGKYSNFQAIFVENMELTTTFNSDSYHKGMFNFIYHKEHSRNYDEWILEKFTPVKSKNKNMWLYSKSHIKYRNKRPLFPNDFLFDDILLEYIADEIPGTNELNRLLENMYWFDINNNNDIEFKKASIPSIKELWYLDLNDSIGEYFINLDDFKKCLEYLNNQKRKVLNSDILSKEIWWDYIPKNSNIQYMEL